MEGRGKPRNLDNFAVVSHGILQTGPCTAWNLAKFPAEDCGPYLWCCHCGAIDAAMLRYHLISDYGTFDK